MNRQSIIVILIGAIASLCGFATIDYFRRRRCTELEGVWTAAVRECRLVSGETPGTFTLGGAVIGVLVGAAVGLTLYRAFMFATGRARRAAST